MCGIVGYCGKENALEILISSLKRLEYRGYDSSGVAYVENGSLRILKAVGRIENLKKEVDFSVSSSLGIAHTRWATHGKPSVLNSHPHKQGKITVVHNGIIENYLALKQQLTHAGYIFYSETDTEVIAALLDFLYQEKQDMILAIQELIKQLEGAYALGILCEDELDVFYAVKKDSPLILAENDVGRFLASDVPAILEYCDSYYVLDDCEFARIQNDITIFDRNGKTLKKELKKYDGSFQSLDKGSYEHFMLKEIYEQPAVFKNLLSYYQSHNWENLRKSFPDFLQYERIKIIACGSAYHAGLVWKSLLEQYLEIETDVYLASEFRYQRVFLDEKILTIFISQSGETADTLKALQLAKKFGSTTLAVVNVSDSSIARNADYILYTRAGSEIAVATTKGYTSQVMIASLIIAMYKKIDFTFDFDFSFQNFLNSSIYMEIAQKIYQKEHIFFIGRGLDYAFAMEGALKLKEISYIHAESYAAGELKHGTISLISEDSYVFGIITDERLKDKTVSNLKEVVARGAKVILIIREDLAKDVDFAEFVVRIPKVLDIAQAIITVLPLQLIAYEVAKLRGCDIDKPKNLAKSVTVE